MWLTVEQAAVSGRCSYLMSGFQTFTEFHREMITLDLIQKMKEVPKPGCNFVSLETAGYPGPKWDLLCGIFWEGGPPIRALFVLAVHTALVHFALWHVCLYTWLCRKTASCNVSFGPWPLCFHVYRYVVVFLWVLQCKLFYYTFHTLFQ